MSDETTDDDHVSPKDIAEQVLGDSPSATKNEWGQDFLRLAQEHDQESIEAFIHDRLVANLGSYVAKVKEVREEKRQQERLMQLGVSYAGRPITRTISVSRSNGGGRQMMLWTEASPAQFIEAVQREQHVIDGRKDSNAVRLLVVKMLTRDETLMGLPTLGDVCNHLDVDPDTLGLEELPRTG